MYTGHFHKPTIILEAVALYDLWRWHAFSGLLGSHNDINVLKRSFIFSDLAEGRTPPVNTQLIVLTIQWDTTLLMAYIRSGQHL